jgi:sugar phosphate isomerase/epimerase
MNRIGYSTGAIALGNFSKALALLADHRFGAIELSALRMSEVVPLLAALPSLDLSRYSYIAFHAPSAFPAHEEERLVELLARLPMEWPIVLHPDAVHDFELWKPLSERLAIENMDGRKSLGRSVRELEEVFRTLPNAKMCLDLGHARQVDSSMLGAYEFLQSFSERIVQLHVSEVDTMSRHDPMSLSAELAFRQLRRFIPKSVAVILESRVSEPDIEQEVLKVQRTLLLA